MDTAAVADMATTPRQLWRAVFASIIGNGLEWYDFLLYGFFAAGIPGMIARLFPTAVRSTGMAIAYNVAVTVFGGLSPLTVTWLIQASQSRMMPAVYLIIAAIISLSLVTATRRVWLRAIPA